MKRVTHFGTGRLISRKHGRWIGPQRLFLRFCITAVLALGAEAGSREFSNLQVLPEDTSTVQLLDVMKDMSIALGAECRTCHRTDTRDFASDELPAKRTAREMMRMVARINSNPPQDGNLNTTNTSCYSCHRGQLRP